MKRAWLTLGGMTFCAMIAMGSNAHGQSTAASSAEADQKTQTAPKTETAPKFDAKKAAEIAENRIDENMVTMSNLVEALSNHLGQLHYLRTLCFGTEDQKWRLTASEMMDIEAAENASRKRELINAFNAGYYEQKERYQTCANTVAIDVAALSENGRRIATMLGDPYRER